MFTLIALSVISLFLLTFVVHHDAKKHGTDLTFD